MHTNNVNNDGCRLSEKKLDWVHQTPFSSHETENKVFLLVMA